MKTQKNISFAYFNKTYNNPRPLDIGTFLLKRNFLLVPLPDKLKALKFGPFKIIIKNCDVTYEIVNPDGYTSHIHRNHLVPHYPKEPIIFPFIQQYNPPSNNGDNDNNDSNINDPIKSFDSFSDEEQSVEDEDHTFTNSIKETDIPSPIGFQTEPFNQYSHFRTKKINKKPIIPTQKTNLIFMTTITILILADTPMTDSISAHNQKRTINFSSMKRIQIHFLKNPAERNFDKNSNR